MISGEGDYLNQVWDDDQHYIAEKAQSFLEQNDLDKGKGAGGTKCVLTSGKS